MSRKASAVVCREHNKPVQVEQINVDGPKRGEVLVRLGACGVCHSDLSAITGTMRSFGTNATLTSIHIDGADLTAMADGLPLHATFVTRVKNGQRAFGLLVHDADVQIDDVTLTQIFCARK